METSPTNVGVINRETRQTSVEKATSPLSADFNNAASHLMLPGFAQITAHVVNLALQLGTGIIRDSLNPTIAKCHDRLEHLLRNPQYIRHGRNPVRKRLVRLLGAVACSPGN